ncbi:MAG: TonB-dependent receptor [Pseudomonadota bacterium]
MQNNLMRKLLCSTVLGGAVIATAAPAIAQDDDDDAIVVTGSRLSNPNLTASSPVYQVDAAEIDARGVTRIEDLVNILPQAFPGQTSELANGATGTSTLDLRGLGAVRTLVLIDGKRLPYGSPNTSAVNLDLIPAQLVEKVDIVTGGASAVYGSDAISGVANFILKRDFEGLQLDGQVGVFQDGNGGEFANELLASFNQPAPGPQLDGRGVNVSALFGANTADGRGNVTAFLQYQDQNEIRQGERDYSACAFGRSSTAPNAVGGVTCAGSSTFRRIGLSNSNDNFPSGLFLNDDGTLVPFTGAPEQLFNFAPDNFIQRNNERFSINAFARYELTDNIEAYLDLGFTENTTDSQIAFSGTFFRNFQINCDNPFLEAAVPGGGTLADAALGCTADQIATGLNPDGSNADVNFGGLAGPGYRNVTGDPRSSFIGISTFRMIGGLRGTIADRFDWDTFGQFARTRLNTASTGDISFQAAQDAFFVVSDDDGNPVCRSGNGSCLPLNIFQRPGGVNQVTPEVAQSIQGNGFNTGTVDQIVLGGTIGGDIGFSSPLAESELGGLVGVEYRRDQLERTPDEISQIPGGLGLTGVGGGTLPVAGEVEVWELFLETAIPLIEDRPLFEELTLRSGYRYSNYSTDGNGVANSFDTNTFFGGLTWVPVQGATVRAQFQRAVRAPNVIELFTGQNTGLFNGTDPCANQPDNGNMPTATAAACANTGVTAAQFGTLPANPAGQLNNVTGGNPFLTAESSDTFTVGLILQPSFVEGLTFAVDYFDISIDDAIATVPAQTSLTQCLNTGAAQFCDAVVRDQDGSLFASPVPPAGSAFQFAGIQQTNANIANLSTSGLDFSLLYNLDLGNNGGISFNYASTILFALDTVPVPGVTTTTECAGLYRGSCGGPNPEYRHRFLATWQSPFNVDFTATWRYTSSVTFDSGQSDSEVDAFVPTGNILDDQLDTAQYLDLSAQWAVRENVNLRFGIQNVFGRDPELSTFAGTAPGNGDTFPAFYDPAGRFLFFGVNLNL